MVMGRCNKVKPVDAKYWQFAVRNAVESVVHLAGDIVNKKVKTSGCIRSGCSSLIQKGQTSGSGLVSVDAINMVVGTLSITASKGQTSGSVHTVDTVDI